MTEPRSGPDPSWRRAELALTLLAIDPIGLRGAQVRARVGPVRDRLREALAAIFPNQRRIHPEIDDIQLFGGVDVARSLAEGRQELSEGLLVPDSVICLEGAERASQGLSARLAQAAETLPVTLLTMDEGADDLESPPETLLDPLAFRIDLEGLAMSATWPIVIETRDIESAARRLKHIKTDEAVYKYLSRAAVQLGITSLRAPVLALRSAKAHASLYARDKVHMDDLRVACELVYAPRATQRPEDLEPPEPPAPPQYSAQNASDPNAESETPQESLSEEILLEAVRALLPPDLLAKESAKQRSKRAAAGQGAGTPKKSNRRGRPLPSRPGSLASGARLDLVSTLRAAIPWQPLRASLSPRGQTQAHTPVQIRRSDFRTKRYEQKSDRLLIFTVDASGSAAFARLAETKGAIELLLGEAYARRDHAALIAFKGTQAELLLPPTRSLTQAKRSLSGLPGGGGTPLAAGLAKARELALQEMRRGLLPLVVLLTDGRANIDLDGEAARVPAGTQADEIAQTFPMHGIESLVIDSGKRPNPNLNALAQHARAN
ncbi:MAG: magnesium chelatase subunit D, partial [Pseudomonadota bacterium]